MTNDLPWSQATSAIHAANHILMVTHVDPDGDAIGSLLGLALALREQGKTVDAAVDGGVPDYLLFLPGTETVLPALLRGEWDLMISLDASDERRTGKVGEFGRAHSRTVINLDHHPTNTMFGDIHLVIPTAVSATEIVLLWLNQMPHPVSHDSARPLLTGLVTDTRGFRTSNVNAATLYAAQQLMEAGASLTEVTARVLDNMEYNVLELWKQTLPSAALEGTVIAAEVTQEHLKQVGLQETPDTGSLVSLLVSVKQAMIAVVFKEMDNGTVEISLRSKPGFDVSQVAFSVGGGGHKQASGATIPGPLAAARARIMPMLQEAARQGTLTIA
jgi:bifunctional oligoribonuclease and PAP phosphatase NrnA